MPDADSLWRGCGGRAPLLLAAAVMATALTVNAARADNLHAALSSLAAEHGFQIKGLDKVAQAPTREASGALRARLKLLLADFNHVLEGTPPDVTRVIILGAKTKPTDVIAVPTTRRGAQHIVRATLRSAQGRDHTVSLMVDTGASTLVLPASMIARLGFRAEELPKRESRTANGRVTGRSARLEQVTVGAAVARDVDVMFIADDTLGDVHLLGMSFLDNFGITIDQKGNRLLLAPR